MSRIERILQAIIDGTSYNEAPQSRIEEILLAIKNDTDYLKSPYSRVETLLLAIKDNTDYSDLLQSRIEEILEHKLHNTVYEKDALSRIEKLLIDWISKADYYELIGIPPLTFVSNGKNLVDYRIYGASGGVGDIKNLFDKNNAVNIYKCPQFWTNGSVIEYSTAVQDIKLTVEKNTIYTIKKKGGNKLGVWAFATDSTAEILFPNDNNASICQFNSKGHTTVYVHLNNGNLPGGGIISDINNLMLCEGNTIPETYEPYGYKIPVVCGGATTNIYLNEPLGENESISMNDTGLSIPTINGSNTLSVGTTVQPSSVYVKYKGG